MARLAWPVALCFKVHVGLLEFQQRLILPSRRMKHRRSLQDYR